jgi:hypothetical protein
LNRTYAVVQVGGNVVILQERADREIALLTQKDFYLLLRNRFVSVPTDDGEAKRTRLADRWLEWGERREYRRLVFKPGEQVVNGEFNLWRGWAVEPSAHGRCDRFLGHLRKVVCGGNREHYEWLLDWLADIIQHPERKLGLVVALQGPQGAGKTLVGAIMKRLLGVYQVVAEKPEHVTGRFNGHLARCLLLQAEEAFWGGDRGAGVLKHLVTGEHLMIERKGIDSEEMPNYTRLLITSNDDWLWPTGMDDRRLVIFKVRGTHRTDKAYFRRLFAEMEAGGYGRLLRFLQTRAIKRRRLEVPPRTVALEEQAVHTMSPEEVWLRDLLKRGIVDGVVDADGRAHVPVGALYDSYVASVPKSRFVKNEEAFSIFLKRSLPRVKGVRYAGPHRFVSARRGYARVQSRGRVVAPLAHCRERYSSRGRAAPQTWGKPKAWIRERGA